MHQRSPAPWARLIDLRRCRCNSEADCGTRRDEARHRRARSGDATARRRRLYAGVGVSFRVLVELRKLGRRICLTAVSRVHNHHVGVAFAEHLNRKPDRLDRGVAVSCRRAEMAGPLDCKWRSSLSDSPTPIVARPQNEKPRRSGGAFLFRMRPARPGAIARTKPEHQTLRTTMRRRPETG